MANRAGNIANRLGVHPDTIRDWTDLFADFFSANAKKGEGVRREYDLNDEIVLNTINELRKKENDFEQIRARLTAGERITLLPSINQPVPPESALQIYEKVTRLETQLEEARKRLELMDAKDQEIIRLNRQIAVLEYQLEQAGKDKPQS